MKDRDLLIETVFDEALTLRPGGDMFVACEDRPDRVKTIKELEKILAKYVSVDPVFASQLVFRATFRDRGHWVRILRKPNDPSVLWKRKEDGTMQKVILAINFKLRRQITLMRRDNWKDEDIFQRLRVKWGDEEVNTYLKEKK